MLENNLFVDYITVEQLLSAAVARQIWKLAWWEGMEKTTRATRSLWMLTSLMLQLATSKNSQHSDMAVKDFFQPDRKSTRLNSSHIL